MPLGYSPYGVPDATPLEWAFTGEQRDSQTGLQFHRARYYAPSMGIFPSRDPFEGVHGRPMSLNGYSWVEGNPVMFTDPSGKQLDLSILDGGFPIEQNSCISDSPFGCDNTGNAIPYFTTQGYNQTPYDTSLCQDWENEGHCGLDIVSHADEAWQWITERGRLFMEYQNGLYTFDPNSNDNQYVGSPYFTHPHLPELIIDPSVFEDTKFRIKGYDPNDTSFLSGRKVYALRSGIVDEAYNTDFALLKIRTTENEIKTDYQIQYIHIRDVPTRLRRQNAQVNRGEYIGTYGLFGQGVGDEPHLHISHKFIPLEEKDGCLPYHLSPSPSLELYSTSTTPSHISKAVTHNAIWTNARRFI